MKGISINMSAVLTITCLLVVSAGTLNARGESTNPDDTIFNRRDKIAITEIPTRTNKIAICFENVVGSTFQSEVISLFSKNDMEATFFFDGARVADIEPQVRELVEKGHEIGNMGLGDDYLTILSKTELETRIKESEKLIAKITGKRPLSFMAPNRVYNQAAADVLKSMNIPPLGCGVLIDYKPAKGCGDIDIYMQYVISQIHGGSVIVVTEKRENLILLRHLLESLKEKRFDVVTVTELGKSSDNAELKAYFSK